MRGIWLSKVRWPTLFLEKSECAQRLVNETLNVTALFPPCRAQFKGMHCFWGSYLIVTLHPYSPLPCSGGSQRMETKQWGQIDLERELPTRPLNFCYPRAPSSLVYLSKPPRWNMDHSNPKLPLHLLPSSPSFICLHYFSCMWRKRSNLADSRDPKDELKEGNGHLDKNTKGRLSSLPLLLSVSRHLKSHLGFISSGFYAWAAWWCANKERKGVREREWESKDVLIKGNSEGLYQIKLHNVVREDTAFETEKMKMTCPQMAIHPHGMKWKCNQFTSVTGIMLFLAWVLHVYLQWRVWSCAAHCGDGH